MNDWKNIEMHLNDSYPQLLKDSITYYASEFGKVDVEEQEYMLNSIEHFKGIISNNIIGYRDNLGFSVWNLRTKSKFPNLIERIERAKKSTELLKDYSKQLLKEYDTILFLTMAQHKEITTAIKKQCDDEFLQEYEELLPICPISLEPIVNHCFLPCGHRFERENIKKLENTVCPLCRQYFNKRELIFDEKGRQVLHPDERRNYNRK